MYINDVHILAYVIALILGFIIGHSIELVIKKVVDNKNIFTNKSAKEILRNFLVWKKTNYINAGIIVILYFLALQKYGIKQELLENIGLIKAFVLIPVLVLIIKMDYKYKIIPNRITLFLFEAGIVFSFLYSVNNLFMTRDYFIAMIIGFAIFGIIALLGRLIAGKEAMGMGDIKLLAVLGLYFGIPLTVSIAILSFIIAGIISIIIAISKKNKNNEYISFGISIGLAALLCIMLPENTVISVLLTTFTLGRYKV